MVGLHGKAGSDTLASQVRSVVLDHLGFWILDLGFGSWIMDLGSWILDLGSWNLDLVSWILDLGSWILDLGSLVLGLRSWILDPVQTSSEISCFGSSGLGLRGLF